MNNPIPAPETIDSFAAFLKYGPTGLAGLMLLLTVVVLLSRSMDPARERLLNRFMYIGAFCFALSLAANFFSVARAYPLYFKILPLDMGAKRTLPKPIISANNKTLDENREYLVKSEVTAIVDVSDAIDYVRSVHSQLEAQRAALQTVVTQSEPLLVELQKIPQIIDRNCSGGSSGVPAASNPAVLAIQQKAVAGLSSVRATSVSAIAVAPPAIRD